MCFHYGLSAKVHPLNLLRESLILQWFSLFFWCIWWSNGHNSGFLQPSYYLKSINILSFWCLCKFYFILPWLALTGIDNANACRKYWIVEVVNFKRDRSAVNDKGFMCFIDVGLNYLLIAFCCWILITFKSLSKNLNGLRNKLTCLTNMHILSHLYYSWVLSSDLVEKSTPANSSMSTAYGSWNGWMIFFLECGLWRCSFRMVCRITVVEAPLSARNVNGTCLPNS